MFEVAGRAEALSASPETLQTAPGTLTVTPEGSSGPFRDQNVRLGSPQRYRVVVLAGPRMTLIFQEQAFGSPRN